ncbi:MAG: hypothetical protein HDQ88_00940 [Clostridia bacterium]|nr:hypothetical protein [Clostridia bacterium]
MDFIEIHECHTFEDVMNELLSEMRAHGDVESDWHDYTLRYMYDGLFKDPAVSVFVRRYLDNKNRRTRFYKNG